MINIETEFNNIYHEYYPVLLRYVGSKRLEQISVDDIANETLTRLWEKRAECSFDSTAQIAAWLIRTSRFVVLEHIRKRQDNEDLADYENTISDGDIIEQHIEDIRLRQYLDKIELTLSERDRIIFRMVFIEHRPYSECAAELKIKEVSLRSSISRLRDRLRPYIDKLLDEEK